MREYKNKTISLNEEGSQDAGDRLVYRLRQSLVRLRDLQQPGQVPEERRELEEAYIRDFVLDIAMALTGCQASLHPVAIRFRDPSQPTDVHTEHCCAIHGCKYGDPDCTVETGKRLQSYPCETCGLIAEGYYG